MTEYKEDQDYKDIPRSTRILCQLQMEKDKIQRHEEKFEERKKALEVEQRVDMRLFLDKIPYMQRGLEFLTKAYLEALEEEHK